MTGRERLRAAGHAPRAWEGSALALLLLMSNPASARPAAPRRALPRPGPGALFVAPTGKDTWSGRLAAPNHGRTDGPLRTLAGARDTLRRRKAEPGGLRQPVTVYLRGGTYALGEPLRFAPQDSGTPECPITYAAYPGETVVVSGGRRISRWEPVTVDAANGRERRLWAARLSGVREGRGLFRQLWVNGQRRPRARHPNQGYLTVAEVPDVTPATQWHEGQTRVRFREGDLRSGSGIRDAELVLMSRWVESHLPVTAVQEGERLVTFGKRSVFQIEPGDPYYLENALAFLDTPGEWYLDRRAGLLYYWPMPGEEMRKAEVIAPVLSQLVRFEGKPESGEFVAHLAFRDLTFAHAEWWFSSGRQGATSEPEPSGFAQAAIGVPGALHAEGLRDARFERCAVAHVGTYGVELGRGCARNRLVECALFDLGAGGVKIGEPRLREKEAEQAHDNAVIDCHIHDGGRIFHSAVGVWIGQSGNNRLTGNHVHDLYYSGFSIGWTWGYGPALAKGNVVERNEVHHIGARSDGDGPILSDMGGIYTLGVSPGTVIRDNVFHDIAGRRYGGWGIYLDEGSSEILVEQNLVYRTTHGGFHQHYGRENLIRNNIFALGRDAQIQLSRPEAHQSFRFERNLVYWREGNLLAREIEKPNAAFDHNLYWRVGGEVRFGRRSWEKWRALGMDAHSLVADPLFVAPEKGDFRLKPESPALKLGFVPIVAAAGTRGQ